MANVDELHAEMIEIDENLIRRNLDSIDEGNKLLRRKQIYEALHPETKATYNGGSFKGNQHKKEVTETVSHTTKSFVDDTAEKMGVSPRTIELKIQTARNLTPEVKENNSQGLRKSMRFLTWNPKTEVIRKAKKSDTHRAHLILKSLL